MRTIRRTNAFKRDFRRANRSIYRDTLDHDINAILVLLQSDAPIPPRYYDHPMRGDWRGYRNCHIRGDLVLLYRKIGNDVLELVGLGSHSHLDL